MKKVLFAIVAFHLLLAAHARHFTDRNSFKVALKAFKERNYFSARTLFEEVLAKYPLGEYGDDAQYYIMLTYFHENEFHKSLFEIKRLHTQYQNSKYLPKAQYWRGECYFFLKKYKASLESHHTFVRKNPSHFYAPMALYTTGYIYSQQKRYDEAIAEFDRALTHYPKSKIAPDIALQIGIAFYNSKEYQNARHKFRELIVKYHKSNMVDEAQFWVGKAFFAENKFEEAEREFNFVLEKFPKVTLAPEAVYYMGLCRYRLKDLNGAIKKLNLVLKKYPQWKKTDEVYYRKGRVYVEQKEIDLALKDFEKLVDQYAQSKFYLPALELIGDLKYNRGRPEEAVAIYDKLLADKRTQSQIKPVILKKKADLLFRMKKYDLAGESYQKFYKTYPEKREASEAMYMNAQSMHHFEKHNAALGLLFSLKRKYPGSKWSTESSFLIAEIYFNIRKFDKSLVHYRKLVKFNKKSKRYYRAYMGVGWSYFELKNYARAENTFRKIIKTFPAKKHRVETYMALATCYYNLRDFKRTLKIYSNVEKRYKKFKHFAEEAMFRHAWVYWRIERYKVAENHFKHYIQKNPRGRFIVGAYFYRAWSNFNLGRFKTSIPLFKKAYTTAKKGHLLKERALLDQAKAEKSAEFHRASIRTFALFIKRYPDSNRLPEAHYFLSEAYLKQKKPNSALRQHRLLKAKHPKSTYLGEIMRNVADYYRDKKQYTKAEAIYNSIIINSLSSDEKVEAKFSKALLFQKTKKYSSTIAVYQEILDEKTESMLAYRPRAMNAMLALHYELGQYDAIIKKGKKLRPGLKENKLAQAETDFWLGRAYYKQSHLKKARLRLKPHVKNAVIGLGVRYFMGLTYIAEQKYRLAYDYFKIVSQKSRGNYGPKAIFQIGEIHFIEKNLKRAIRNYVEIIYSHSDQKEIYEKSLYKTALCFKRLSKKKEYNSYYKKLSEAFPRSKYLATLKSEPEAN